MTTGFASSAYGQILPAAVERVDGNPSLAVAAGENPLRQMEMPLAGERPAEHVPGPDGLTLRDDGVDVAVAEMAEPDDRLAGSCVARDPPDLAALERVDTVRPAGRRAPSGPVVAHGDVDAVVVVLLRPRIEERAANRMLAVSRRDRPAPVVVVVATPHRTGTLDSPLPPRGRPPGVRPGRLPAPAVSRWPHCAGRAGGLHSGANETEGTP